MHVAHEVNQSHVEKLLKNGGSLILSQAMPSYPHTAMNTGGGSGLVSGQQADSEAILL